VACELRTLKPRTKQTKKWAERPFNRKKARAALQSGKRERTDNTKKEEPRKVTTTP